MTQVASNPADGLTTQLSDSEITELLSTDVSAEETCGLLINAANVAGGQDNTTVVLAHFTDGTTPQLKRKVEIVSSQKQQFADSLSAGEISLCWPTDEADVPDSQRLPLPHYSDSSQVP